MPKNITGGNRAKKAKNSGQRVERQLIFADSSGSQKYGIIEAFGGSTATVKYIRPTKDGKQTEVATATGFIRSNLRRWCKRFTRGDVILICEREFETGKVDIIHKYNDDELRGLKRNQSEYIKVQPLIDAYSMKMEKTGSKKLDADGPDFIEFDEQYSAESEDEEPTGDELQRAMNEEFSDERQGKYNQKSSHDKANKNAKYRAEPESIVKSSGGKSIKPQTGTREMPPSSEDEEEILA